MKNPEDHEMSVANVCKELEAIDEVLRKELPSYKERLDEGDILQDEEEAQLLRLSFELMAAECSTYDLCMADERYSGLLEQIEMKLRGLRESANRMWATSVERTLTRELKAASDYGFVVKVVQDSLVFQMPYELVSLSELFMVRSKRLSGLGSLSTVRRTWTLLVESGLRTVDLHSVGCPFWEAGIEVRVKTVHRRPLDPDHFWIRPVIDALISQGVMFNDDANHLSLTMVYETKSNSQYVEFVVKKSKKLNP